MRARPDGDAVPTTVRIRESPREIPMGDVRRHEAGAAGTPRWSTFRPPVAVQAADPTTSPKAFSAIVLHKERLWMPDKDNESLLRYTEFTNPFVSDDLNFVELAEGDDTDIKAVGVQNDLVTSFKDNSIFVADMTDPSDDTTLTVKKSPANFGIVSSKALVNVEDRKSVV